MWIAVLTLLRIHPEILQLAKSELNWDRSNKEKGSQKHAHYVEQPWFKGIMWIVPVQFSKLENALENLSCCPRHWDSGAWLLLQGVNL